MAVVPEVTVENFIKDYEQIRTPDFAKIADYVNYAKGEQRNMVQFSEATGIGASTLSRIVNGKSTKPLTKDIIVKIYEARANADAVLLLDMLANANGMYPSEYAEKVKSRDNIAARRNEEISRERLMKNAIIAGAASNGITVSQVVNQPVYRSSAIPAFMPNKRGDFLIKLPSPDGNPNIGYCWSFFLFPQMHDDFDHDPQRSLNRLVRRVLEKATGWFVMDAWDMEIVKGDKFSFCFIDEKLFQAFIDTLKVAKLKTEMTAILLNPTTYTVEKEVWLPGQYTRFYDDNIFENTKDADEFSENDYDEEDFE